ncbi:MAG: hypothetical protein VX911_05030 [Candidatus Latescibacterota bacterium]|nr:hypothetical protein [Candidatus Latescibacterota bacterium]
MFLAARGARATAGGTESIEDGEVAEGLLRKSRSIHGRALLIAIALTAALLAGGYLLPWRFPPALQ